MRRVNYQPSSAATPPGYDIDDGSDYGTHGEYGWLEGTRTPTPTATPTITPTPTFGTDSDGDGLPDWWEIQHFGDLSHNGTGDEDGDGLDNDGEYANWTDPNNPDSDTDGYYDGEEVTNNSNPTDETSAPYNERKIVISEVLYDAAGADDGNVFVEIFGPAGSNVGNYRIELRNGAGGGETGDFDFPAGSLIPDDGNGWGFLVVADGEGGSTSVVNADFIENSFDPQNGPDNVLLKDPSGIVIDALGYGNFSGATFLGEGNPAPDVGQGHSLARSPDANTDTDDNLADFSDTSPSTPGEGPLPSTGPGAMAPTPAAGELIINEIAWGGTGADSTHQWMELYNPSNHALDLVGTRVRAGDGSPTVYVRGEVRAHHYYLIEFVTDNAVSDVSADFVYGGGQSLEAGGESLFVTNPDSTDVDSANQGAWYAGNSTLHLSMERIDPGAGGTDSGNWKGNNTRTRSGLDDDGDPIMGTPRQANSALPASISIGFEGDDDRNPAFSPDGSLVAFESYNSMAPTPVWNICVASADGSGSPTRLTDDAVNNDTYPCWSSDGSYIYFLRDYANGEVYRVLSNGSGSPDKLTTEGSGLHGISLSPDGSKMIYPYSAGKEMVCRNTDTESGVEGWALVTEDDHNTSSPGFSPCADECLYKRSGRLYERPIDSDGDGFPDAGGTESLLVLPEADSSEGCWSPSVEKIAYSSTDGGRGIRAAAPGDAESRYISEQHNTATIDSPDWSPDTTRLAYHSDRTGDSDIVIVDYIGVTDDEGPAPRAIISSPLMNRGVAGDTDILGTAADNVSVDGGAVLSSLSSYTLEYRKESDPDIPANWHEFASSTEQVINGVLGTVDVSDLDAESYIIRLAASDGADEAMDLVRVYVSHALVLSTGEGNARNPAFSPDGTKIAYQCDANGNWDIYVANVAGTPTPLQVTSSEDDETDPHWSPDGTMLSFTSNGSVPLDPDDTNVWTAYSSDGVTWSTRPLICTGYNDREARWSPDGADFIFRCWSNDIRRHPSNRTISSDLNTLAPKIVETGYQPFWSPDGSRLVYTDGPPAPTPTPGNIFVCDTAQPTPTPLTADNYNNVSPCFSPDGDTIAFQSMRTNRKGIWVADEAFGLAGTELTSGGIEECDMPSWSPERNRIAYHSFMDDTYRILIADSPGPHAPLCNLTSPLEGETVSSEVSLIGTAADNLSVDGVTTLSALESYTLSYRPDGGSWDVIGTYTSPVTNGLLGSWETFDKDTDDYDLKLEVQDAAPNTAQEQVQVSVIGGISNVRVSRDEFNPAYNLPVIAADLSEEADWTITIKDAAQAIVREYSGTGTSIVQVWDGLGSVAYNGGTVVSDGSYTFTITATSTEDSLDAVPQSGSITVDSTCCSSEPVDISEVGISSQSIDPSASETAEISYFLGMDSDVTLEIYRSWLDFDINEIPPLGTDTAALWHCNEGPGDTPPYNLTTNDSTTNGNDGALGHDSIWSSPGWGGGGYCLSFDSTDDIVTISDSATLDVTDEIAVQMWVKLDGDQSALASPLNKEGANSGYGFEFTSARGLIFWVGNGSAKVSTAEVSLPENGVWYHVVGQAKEDEAVEIYLDGTLGDSVSLTGGIAANDEPLTIGNHEDYSNRYLQGSVDEIRLWNSTLTPAEIERLHLYQYEFISHYKNVGWISVADDPIRTINDTQNVGANSLSWDGRDDSNDLVPLSAYLYVVTADGGTGTVGTWGEINPFVLNSNDVREETLLYNTLVEQELDPYKNEPLVLSYELEESAWLTLGAAYPDDTPVSGWIVKGAPRATGAHSEQWDGRDLDGNIITETVITGHLTTVIPENHVIIQSDLDIGSNYVDGYVIFVTYDPISEIKYALSAQSDVTVKVYDPDGNYFRTLVDEAGQSAGEHTVTWDGKDDAGELPSDAGDYMVVLTATDSANPNAVAEKTVNVLVYK